MRRGITSLIPKVFAPLFKFKKLKIPRNPGGLKKRAAKRRGQRLDSELDTNKLTRVCAETKLIRETLENLKLDIVDTQVMVQNELLKTFLDMVVKHKETGKQFVVEIKRGCHYRRCAIGKLKHQSRDLSDCLLYQHQLQALIGRWIANHEQDWGVLLIYVDSTSVEVLQDFEAQLTEAGKAGMLAASKRKQILQTNRAAKRRKT